MDGGIVMGVLHGVTCFVTGDADGGGGNVVIHAVRQADHICLGIVVVGKVTGNMLDAYICNAVASQHPVSCLGAGEPAAGCLLGIFLEGAVYPVACPQRKQHTGEHQHNIGKIKAVIEHKIKSFLLLLYPS